MGVEEGYEPDSGWVPGLAYMLHLAEHSDSVDFGRVSGSNVALPVVALELRWSIEALPSGIGSVLFVSQPLDHPQRQQYK